MHACPGRQRRKVLVECSPRPTSTSYRGFQTPFAPSPRPLALRTFPRSPGCRPPRAPAFPTASPTESAYSGRPWRYSCVPSMGSTIHARSQPSRCDVSWCSSLSHPSPGNAAVSRAWRISAAWRSASETSSQPSCALPSPSAASVRHPPPPPGPPPSQPAAPRRTHPHCRASHPRAP